MVEPQIVVLDVAGSSPVGHPIPASPFPPRPRLPLSKFLILILLLLLILISSAPSRSSGVPIRNFKSQISNFQFSIAARSRRSATRRTRKVTGWRRRRYLDGPLRPLRVPRFVCQHREPRPVRRPVRPV